jgi:EAL domain-containing protein (putative c-di-GMP-specific phosphodiesterase class I)
VDRAISAPGVLSLSRVVVSASPPLLRRARRRAVADAGAHFFAESLVRAARQLDIPVIAHHVEDEAIYQAILSIGFSGYQGNLGGGPRTWPAS